MYRKKKKNNKTFYILLGVLTLTVVLVIFFNTQNFIETSFFKSAKDITEKAKNMITSPFINISSKISNLGDYNKVLEINDNLEKQLQEFSITKEQNESLKKEIEILKEEMNLENIYSDYELETATITNRNTDYWFNQITINKGEESGIKVGDAVVTAKGLIGKVNSVTKSSATIRLITAKSEDMKISVGVKGNDRYYHGTILDYQDGFIIVEGITNYDGVNINSRVITSGLGTFPSDILVGYVAKVENDNYDTSKILYVEPTQDMNDLHYVTVLKEKAS